MPYFFGTMALFIGLISGSVCGQSKIPFLKEQLVTATMDTARSRIYYELGGQYPDIAVDSSLYFLNRSLISGKMADNSFLIAQALWKLGFVQMYYERNDAKAISLFYQSIAIAQKHNDYLNLARCYMYLAMVAYHQRTGNWTDLLAKAEVYAKLAHNWQVLSDVYAMSSNIYAYNGQHQQASETIRQAMLSSKPGTGHWFSFALDYAESLVAIGKTAEATAVYRKLSAIKSQLSRDQSDFVHYNDLARLEIGLKNYAQAERLLQSMVMDERARVKPDSFHLFIMTRTLRQLYKEQRNYKKAFQMANELADLRVWKSNKEQTIDSRLKMTQLRAALDLEKKERQIAQLKAREQQNQVYLTGALLVAAMLVSFVVVLQRAKRRIERQSTELMQLNHTKDKLFAILSHDLHSPVASLKNLLGLTNWGELSQREFAEATQILNKQVSTLLTVLENLLNWAMSQMGGIYPRFNAINLFPVVDEQISLLRPIAETKGINLVNALPSDIPLTADANQLGVVFRNLLQNALKFTHTGGQIEVRCSYEPTRYMIYVKDTGIGIPQALLDQLFRAGSATSRPGTTGEKGAGLGLVIVNELVEANRGSLSVSSKEGTGTTFTIILPRPSYITKSLQSEYIYN
ncbi:sensor histidine kinase [Spirosoma aerolatum]|uniref:sensor histidine kinase n=1 Tax=Spirosoma aerolatum TaxID=1211326 RepID=UPI0009AE5F1D|nr:HAMP domain-containing sensor histidine kinase [Spirosoma aerolatum]